MTASMAANRAPGRPSTHIHSDDDQDARGPRSRTSIQPVSPEDAQRYGPRSRRRSNDRRQMLRQLESFVIGASNRLAYQASLSMAEEHEAAPKMLFLHGECGIGKTHLLQGVIDQRIRASKNALTSRRVRYVTGEEFTNEYIAAVRSGKIDNFRSRIRQLDLLAIDDIHFLSNKTATQNEFLHTLDAISLSGARSFWPRSNTLARSDASATTDQSVPRWNGGQNRSSGHSDARRTGSLPGRGTGSPVDRGGGTSLAGRFSGSFESSMARS